MYILISSDNGKLFRYNPISGLYTVARELSDIPELASVFGGGNRWLSSINPDPRTGGWLAAKEFYGTSLNPNDAAYPCGTIKLTRSLGFAGFIPAPSSSSREFETSWLNGLTMRVESYDDTLYRMFDYDDYKNVLVASVDYSAIGLHDVQGGCYLDETNEKIFVENTTNNQRVRRVSHANAILKTYNCMGLSPVPTSLQDAALDPRPSESGRQRLFLLGYDSNSANPSEAALYHVELNDDTNDVTQLSVVDLSTWTGMANPRGMSVEPAGAIIGEPVGPSELPTTFRVLKTNGASPGNSFREVQFRKGGAAQDLSGVVISSSGVTVNGTLPGLIDGNTGTNGFHVDSAGAGAWVRFDFPEGKDFDEMRFYVSGSVSAIWTVQKLVGGVWVNLKTGFNCGGGAGWKSSGTW